MSHTFCFILLASFAALHSFRHHSSGQTCGISAIPPILSSPSVQNLEGGYPAVAHSWPWLVSLQHRDFILNTHWGHMCVGILVSPRLIITDGMCSAFDNALGPQSPFNWLVILGAQNNSIAANYDNAVTIESFSDTVLGGLYRYQGNMILSKAVPGNDFTNSICVGGVTFPVGYTECFTAEWNGNSDKTGWDYNGKNLHQAQMMLVSLEQYQNETGETVVGLDNAITAVVISSSGFPSWRELGQPLMCRSWCNRAEGQWFLVGVATGYSVRKGRFDNKTYAFFNKYVAQP